MDSRECASVSVAMDGEAFRTLSMMPQWAPDEDPEADSRNNSKLRLGMVSPLRKKFADSVWNTEQACESSFIEPKPATPYSEDPSRQRVARFLESAAFEVTIAAITFTTFAIMILDTDARASQATLSWGFEAVLLTFLVLQIMEFLAHAFVERSRTLHSIWNQVDLIVILGALLDYGIALGGAGSDFGIVRMLRLTRVVRLLKTICRLPFFRELRKLVMMLGGCMKTLFWSVLLLLLAMVMWAILVVEFLHPLVREMAAAGMWSGCDRCATSFSSVFHASLTLFSTIVAGDSWGVLAIPIIEAHPWTAAIFAGALLTLVFGILNLIVAVVVDTFAEARAKDIFTRAQELAWEEQREKKLLTSIFKKIDQDGNGTIELQELLEGAKQSPEFANWLRVLDVDSKDLREVFEMLDLNGNGVIELREFVETMYRLKNGESKTITRMMQQKLASLGNRQREVDATLRDMRSAMVDSFPKLSSGLSEVSSHLVQSEDHIKSQLTSHEAAIKESLEAYMNTAVAHAISTAASKLQKPEKSRRRSSISPSPRYFGSYEDGDVNKLSGSMSVDSEAFKLASSRSDRFGSARRTESKTSSRRKSPRPKEQAKVPQTVQTGRLLLDRSPEPECADAGLGGEIQVIHRIVVSAAELQDASPLPECRRSPPVVSQEVTVLGKHGAARAAPVLALDGASILGRRSRSSSPRSGWPAPAITGAALVAHAAPEVAAPPAATQKLLAAAPPDAVVGPTAAATAKAPPAGVQAVTPWPPNGASATLKFAAATLDAPVSGRNERSARSSARSACAKVAKLQRTILRELAEDVAPGIDTIDFPQPCDEFLQALAKVPSITQTRLNQCLTKNELAVTYGPSKFTKLQQLYDHMYSQQQAIVGDRAEHASRIQAPGPCQEAQGM